VPALFSKALFSMALFSEASAVHRAHPCLLASPPAALSCSRVCADLQVQCSWRRCHGRDGPHPRALARRRNRARAGGYLGSMHALERRSRVCMDTGKVLGWGSACEFQGHVECKRMSLELQQLQQAD